mmetsp:Transcript_373/g.902  ORF Transcript_373/g.902 Transcript_373/m.902 type:complete len:222 (-) Transcript_373:54-719(-)
MISEDRERLACQGPRCHMEDARHKLSCDLVHVGNHEQETLRGRESRGQSAHGQASMYSASRSRFGLQLRNAHGHAENVAQALRRPGLGELSHGRGRRDGEDEAIIAQAVGHVSCGLAPVPSADGLLEEVTWVRKRGEGTHGVILVDRRATLCRFHFRRLHESTSLAGHLGLVMPILHEPHLLQLLVQCQDPLVQVLHLGIIELACGNNPPHHKRGQAPITR